MKIVAISGWKGSGKDSFASVLLTNFGFERIGFADPLKDNVADHFALSRQSLDNQAQKELPLLDMPVNPRDAYTRMVCEFLIKEFRFKDGRQPTGYEYADGQFYGSSGTRGPDRDKVYWTRRALCILEGSTKRAADPDYWVTRAINTARFNEHGLVVISDLRYKNELSALKLALQPGDVLTTIRINRFDSSPSSDPSERDLDDAEFDMVVENRGPLADLIEVANDFGKKVSGT